MSRRRVRVLIVEDSPSARQFLMHVFEGDAGFELVGAVTDGNDALAAVRRLQPDVVTMDVHMPGMGGLEATRRIMQEAPRPIVVVSGTVRDQVAVTFEALEAGALAFVSRPSGIGHAQHEREVAELLRTVRLMSEVKVVRRSSEKSPRPPAPGRRIQIVAVGASTGGPLAIQELLRSLPQGFAVPVLIVQHIAEGFLGGFVDWLTRTTSLEVRLAAAAEAVRPGRAYVAPDGFHMGVDACGRIRLSSTPPENGLRPSVAHLMRSVREAYGADAAAVLLSGMGKDGAGELLALKHCGAATFAQDRASSVVHGMPGEAIRLDAARHVLAPAEIAAALRELAGS